MPGGADYGTDVLVFMFDHRGFTEIEHIKLQVKTSENMRPLRREREFSFPIDRKDLAQWLEEPCPVILVRHDAALGVSYWLYVQRYFESLPGFGLAAVRKRFQVRLDAAKILDEDAMRLFREYKNAVAQQLRQVSHARGR